jgi:integrase
VSGCSASVTHGWDIATEDDNTPIFRNTQGGYWNDSNLNNRYWLPFRQRAGYEWVTFRTFHKTVAELLDGAGLTARQIADILGHANPSMIQDVYSDEARSRAMAQRLWIT